MLDAASSVGMAAVLGELFPVGDSRVGLTNYLQYILSIKKYLSLSHALRIMEVDLLQTFITFMYI